MMVFCFIDYICLLIQAVHTLQTQTHPACFYANQQCHVKRNLDKINDSCAQMSIKTSDCSLSIGIFSMATTALRQVKSTVGGKKVHSGQMGPDRTCVSSLKYSPANSLIGELFHSIELLLHLRCLSSRAA